jgi:hypothetical protein
MVNHMVIHHLSELYGAFLKVIGVPLYRSLDDDLWGLPLGGQVAEGPAVKPSLVYHRNMVIFHG